MPVLIVGKTMQGVNWYDNFFHFLGAQYHENKEFAFAFSFHFSPKSPHSPNNEAADGIATIKVRTFMQCLLQAYTMQVESLPEPSGRAAESGAAFMSHPAVAVVMDASP